jgi:ferredoxin
MDGVYEALAARLDDFPQGFPRTESGVELRILEKIYARDEAALAVQLPLIPEPLEAVARRIGVSPDGLGPVLDRMVGRGQIVALRQGGEKRYGLAPFVVGVYEFQLPRIDPELARLVEEYAPHLAGAVGGLKPALARVIPVRAHLEATATILPHEDVRAMLAGARSFRLMPCICRTERAAIGKPCAHPLETCLAFSAKEGAHEGTLPDGFGRPITDEEAHAVLNQAEQAGLVHCTYNVRRESMFICNCCTCCCGFLRGVKEFGAPHLLVRSNWVSVIDAERCTGCGLCAAGRCPMDAVRQQGDRVCISAARCIGCGVCAAACPTGALRLQSRPRAERATPPRNIVTWAVSRSVQRHGLLGAARRIGGLALQAARPRRRTTGRDGA